MTKNQPYYIAETAFHHEGNLDFLKKLVQDISELSTDAIKFHLLFNLNDYIVSNHPANEVLKGLTFNVKEWESIFKLVEAQGKEIVLLCNDLDSLKFALEIQNNYPIVAIELHSTGLNDFFLLKEVIKFNKTVILGVGGSTFDEIQFAVDFLRGNGKSDILLMHGFQNYPTNYEDINFKRINLLRKAFNLSVGYADHTDPLDDKNAIISTLPIMDGVLVLEKHVTNVFGEKRIDSQAAVSLDEMVRIIDLGNVIYKTIGKTALEYSLAEMNYGNTGPMKKALVARQRIKAGETLSEENIAFKRTETSSPLLQKDFNRIIGGIAISDIEIDEILSFSNVQYEFKKASFEQFFIKK